MKQSIYTTLIIVIIVLAAGLLFWLRQPQSNNEVSETNDQAVQPPPQEYDIIVTSPQPGDSVASPLIVAGSARGSWYFEASFPIKLLDQNSQVLATGIAQAQGDWMTENLVPFSATLTFAPPVGGGSGTLIINNDNPSGDPNLLKTFTVPVVFGAINPEDAMTLKIYLGNSQLDPQVLDCNKVFMVERQALKSEAVGQAALNALLAGPTADEKAQGYFSSINQNTKLQSLNIVNGTATADFDSQLELQVGGSCRVTAIRAQITETLKQFPTVQNVVISINGRTEDILQP